MRRAVALGLAVVFASPVPACEDPGARRSDGSAAASANAARYSAGFSSVPMLAAPRTGVLARVVRSDAASPALAGTILRLDADHEIAPVATLRQLRSSQPPDSLPLQEPQYEDIVVAGQKCPAVLAALMSVRDLSFRPMFGLEDELACADGTESCERKVTFCADPDEYRLEIRGSTHIEKRWSSGDDDAATGWLVETIEALRKCPGVTITARAAADAPAAQRR